MANTPPSFKLPTTRRPLPFFSLEAWVIGCFAGLSLTVVGLSWWFINQHQNLIYPGLSIDGIPIGGLTKEAALMRLQHQASPLPDYTFTLQVDDIQIASSAADLGIHRDYATALDQAFGVGHEENFGQRLISITQTLTAQRDYAAPLKFDAHAVKKMVETLAQRVDIQGQKPQASLLTSNQPNSLKINAGSPGREIDQMTTMHQILSLVSPQKTSLTPTVASTAAELSPEQLIMTRKRLEKFVGKNVTLEHPEYTTRVPDTKLIELLALPEGYDEAAIDQLLQTWEQTTNRPAQNAEFEYDPDTLKVITFVPPRDGLTLDSVSTENTLVSLLKSIDTGNPTTSELTGSLALATTKPEKSLADTNNLGIVERIGIGDSEYAHSIPTRIHNVSLTSSKINHTIVKPDEEFSFNKTLGEVSQRTGFKPAYVIRNGRTELGDGGGVCQVSTTLFRAVLNGGLPVTRRLQHSYRVSYYELNAKPGIDATVYAGNVDFRFKNDTGHHLLILSEANPKNLTMRVEIYGTSDGRTAEIVEHEIWDSRPALPPVYIDDPSLPPGVTKQIDWAVGGVKTKFKNIVKDHTGQVIREEEYYSNYRPWSAKYLRGPQI